MKSVIIRSMKHFIPQQSPALPMTPSLWMLIVAQLNPRQIEFKVSDLAHHFNIKEHSLRDYCRALWPDYNGHYHLDFAQAVVLIYRVCRDGKRLPAATSLFNRLLDEGRVSKHFPHDFPLIEKATDEIFADRRRRAAARPQHPLDQAA